MDPIRSKIFSFTDLYIFKFWMVSFHKFGSKQEEASIDSWVQKWVNYVYKIFDLGLAGLVCFKEK